MFDKEKIKEKLDRLSGKTQAKKSDKTKWFPVKGEKSQIRILPYPHGEDPIIELWFHYNVGGKHVLCLERNYGKECPVCQEGRKLAKSQLKEDKELGKKLFPKQRFFAFVVDRKDEQPSPKLWGFGVTIYKKLLSALLDEDYSNFLDPVHGLDATVEVTQEEGKTYPDTSLEFRRKESKLANADEQIKEIMKSIPKVEEIQRPMNEVQIRKLIEDWLSFGVDDNKQDVQTVKGKGVDELVSDKEPERMEELNENIDKVFDDI